MLGALQPAGIETRIWKHHELVKPAGLVERVGRSQCRCISGMESWRSFGTKMMGFLFASILLENQPDVADWGEIGCFSKTRPGEKK